VKCKSCGADLDLTMGECPACGASSELGRLTGILGVVCRACDAYNEPGARTCASCGKPLVDEPPAPPAPLVTPVPLSPAAESAVAPGATLAPGPGSPLVRSFPKPAAGAVTRFVPSVLRPSAARPEAPAHTPIPRAHTCPRCGAEAGAGRFCAQCGQPLGAKGTHVMMNPIAPARGATQAFGAVEPEGAPGPLEPGRASLVVDAGEGLHGATFRLAAETVEAGRSKGGVVFPDDPCLAPHHATFFYRGGSLHVRDEGAAGGVFLRLRGISVPLRPGDTFAVGDRLLRYAGPVPAPLPPAPDGTRRLGSPRPPAPGMVVEECLEGGIGGRAFVRAGPAVTIGRTGCSVSLGDDPQLSQAHAQILLDAHGSAKLKDLGSTSGTYVRIPPHAERELHDGDCVRLGREVLRVAVA
jgi:pSer/pThr/pTyr-binding forkhead associated (FHA) protein